MACAAPTDLGCLVLRVPYHHLADCISQATQHASGACCCLLALQLLVLQHSAPTTGSA